MSQATQPIEDRAGFGTWAVLSPASSGLLCLQLARPPRVRKCLNRADTPGIEESRSPHPTPSCGPCPCHFRVGGRRLALGGGAGLRSLLFPNPSWYEKEAIASVTSSDIHLGWIIDIIISESLGRNDFQSQEALFGGGSDDICFQYKTEHQDELLFQ